MAGLHFHMTDNPDVCVETRFWRFWDRNRIRYHPAYAISSHDHPMQVRQSFLSRVVVPSIADCLMTCRRLIHTSSAPLPTPLDQL